MFNVISFGFHSLGSHPRFYLSLFVSHFQDTALCSIYVNSQFIGFPSLGCCRWFYLSLFNCSSFVLLTHHHWDSILGSIYRRPQVLQFSMNVMSAQFLSKAYLFFFLLFFITRTPSQVYLCLFIWFPIIGMSSYVIPRISRLFLLFLIVVTPQQFLSMFVLSSQYPNIGIPSYIMYRFIVSSFYFQSLGSHPKLYLWLFICSIGFSSLGPHPRFYLLLIVSSFSFQSLGSNPRLYPHLFVYSFCF